MSDKKQLLVKLLPQIISVKPSMAKLRMTSIIKFMLYLLNYC